MNVLLTSAGRRTYLVDYFKKAVSVTGGAVYAANSEMSPALAVADNAIITPLIYDPDYIPFLLEVCEKRKIDLVVPLFDIDLPVLSQNKRLFEEKNIAVAVSDTNALKICNDKWETIRFLSSQGIDVPKSWLDAHLAAKALKEGAAERIIIKPRWGMGSIGIFTAEHPDEVELLGKICERRIYSSYLKYETAATPQQAVIYQEYIAGQEYGMDVVCDLQGNYRTTWVREKLAMRAGETDVARMTMLPELEKISRRISLPGQRGNLDVDLIAKDGKYYPIDLNARFGGGYPFSHVAGADLPAALVAWASGTEPKKEWQRVQYGEIFYKDINIQTMKSR